MTHRLLMLALLLCGSACIYGSEFCSRDDAETVTTITNEITRGMNPQSFITMSTDSFVQYVFYQMELVLGLFVHGYFRSLHVVLSKRPFV